MLKKMLFQNYVPKAPELRDILARELPWLFGFPTLCEKGILWWHFFESKADKMPLDIGIIDPAITILSQLGAKFPEDREFLSVVHGKLNYLKKLIRGEAAHILGPFLNLPGDTPYYRICLAWLFLEQNTTFEKVDLWFQSFQNFDDCFANEHLERIILLAVFAQHHDVKLLRPVLEWLLNYANVPFHSGDLASKVGRLTRRSHERAEILANPRTTEAIQFYLTSLIDQPIECQQHSLKAFSLVAPVAEANAWSLWWSEVCSLLENIDHNPKACLVYLKKYLKQQPPLISIRICFRVIRDLALVDRLFAKEILNTLGMVSMPRLRFSLLSFWVNHAHESSLMPQIKEMAHYLKRNWDHREVALTPWVTFSAADPIPTYYCPPLGEDQLTDEAWVTYFGYLEKLLELPKDALMNGPLVVRRLMGIQIENLVLYAEARAKKSGRDFTEHEAMAAYLLCLDDPEQFSPILDSLESNRDVVYICHGISELLKNDLRSVVAQLCKDKAWGGFAIVGLYYDLIRRFYGTIPKPEHPKPSKAEWIYEYPSCFHDELELLEGTHPRALWCAQKVLGTYFPKPEALLKEIHYLEKHGHSPSEQIRLERLKQRLTQKGEVSKRKENRLKRKLMDRVRRGVILRWEQRLHEIFTQIVEENLGLKNLSKEVSWLLPYICDLEEPYKGLALSLIRKKEGPKPWDLRDQDENRVFLENMGRLGLNIEPWLNGIGTRIYEIENGVSLHLILEDDPVEIIRMGHHFRTCLRPNDFQFFSAVANAADINKAVIYGRTPEGRIVGRCLIALSDQGGLLTFTPYCHEPVAFDEMVAEFVEELAEAMGAVTLTQGAVVNLVAPAWYDDGPKHLVGRFQFLNNYSSFNKALEQMGVDEFLECIAQEFAPLPLNARTLPLVFQLPKFLKNKKLVQHMFPQIMEYREFLTPECLCKLAKLTCDNGDLINARTLVDLFHQKSQPNQTSLETLLNLNPNDLLEEIKKLHGVAQHWGKERKAWLYYWEACALRMLGQNGKAIKHLQQAKEWGSQDLCREIEKRMTLFGTG